jgi:hypothetical protein
VGSLSARSDSRRNQPPRTSLDPASRAGDRMTPSAPAARRYSWSTDSRSRRARWPGRHSPFAHLRTTRRDPGNCPLRASASRSGDRSARTVTAAPSAAARGRALAPSRDDVGRKMPQAVAQLQAVVQAVQQPSYGDGDWPAAVATVSASLRATRAASRGSADLAAHPDCGSPGTNSPPRPLRPPTRRSRPA